MMGRLIYSQTLKVAVHHVGPWAQVILPIITVINVAGARAPILTEQHMLVK